MRPGALLGSSLVIRRTAVAGLAVGLAGVTLALPASPATPAMTEATTTELPAELRSLQPPPRLQGTGELRFFGLRVYVARLWAAAAIRPEDYARQAFALELRYDRKLEGEAIAERSLAEMRRVGPLSEEQARRWLGLMKQAFPDVAAQDRLLGLHDGQGGVRFFHNGRLTASVDDADYARLFFGIWLAPQTSAPALRAALLGLAR